MHTYPQSSERGNATPLVLIVILLLAVAGGAYWYVARPSDDAMEHDNAMMDDGDTREYDDAMPAGDAIDDHGSSPTVEPSSDGESREAASVREYTQTAYDAAVASGPVVLYYYANWCPVCAVEFPKFQAAVATFDASDATFFRVNFNDSETTDAEEASAREHQVGYQHTVVIVQNGAPVYKSQSTADYAGTIRSYLQ